MRNALLVFAGALAISAALTAPASARNNAAQSGEDKSTSSSSCSAYQQGPDGSWEPLPCKETGERAQPQTHHRTPTQGTDHEER
ncbi:hypothetical protein XH88_04735 [Bradyrhizobium sp. CCBAU 51627]|nr:hypothetical protein [Bradyrhizobium sp. CCBAU 51627]MDA9431107.1 hypothetical protein [Bradyrhizobium sp. CCBAU 51627]